MFLLEFVGIDHHGDGLVDSDRFCRRTRRIPCELDQGISGLVQAVVTHKPPRGLRGKKRNDKDGEGPDPLNSVGNSPAPVAVKSETSLENARCNQLTNAPASIDEAG